MKSVKKKKDSLSQDDIISVTDDTKAFLNLMENSGVRQLKSVSDSHPDDHTVNTINEPIVFEEISDWKTNLSSLSLDHKFSGFNDHPQRKRKRKLKITKAFAPDDILDLHGKTRDEALSSVQAFIQTSICENYQAILIITGKGINSKEKGGVLGKSVWDWLKHCQINRSIRFQWAPPFLGGKGAILVFF
ncbi:Smr/MutS family protein [bacterium]|nr:Smr/MutS family protein [bacterium]